MSSEPNPEDIEQNKQWFDWYVDRLENHSMVEPPQEGITYRCPCCAYKTLRARGGYEICRVCFWEDDGQDAGDVDVVRAGPNGALSLTQARANYRNFGACEQRFTAKVREPLPEEL